MSQAPQPIPAPPDGASLPRFPWALFLALGTLLLLACLALAGAYIRKFGSAWSDRQEHWGQFSDFLGGLLNPLIGVAGFIGVIITLRQQHRTLDLQYEQIKAERQALQEEREALQRTEAAQRAAEEERRTSEKIARMIGMVETWDSQDFKEAQRLLREAFRLSMAVDGTFRFNHGPGLEEKVRVAMTRVYTFYARLELMLQGGLIREQDVLSLLGDDTTEWMEYLGAVDFSPKPDAEPSVARDYFRREEWYRRQVFPFSDRFDRMRHGST